MEKCIGHRLKLLGIVQQIWAALRKLFAPPGDPSWLRAWQPPKMCRVHARSQVLSFLGKNTHLGGKIFVFISCLKQIFPGHNQIWGTAH